MWSCRWIKYQKMDAQYASAKGIPTSVSDDGGWRKIFDHNTRTYNNNLVDCISGNCTWNGTDRFNDACRQCP
ncbi:MAG: hypothetical protein JXR45_22940 [Deltaproteobacteria bacterium]|nr:hypothetical protein [Deltaproteobacteria bacterium]